MQAASLSTVARHLNFIIETEGPNQGFWVEFLQRRVGGKAGDSWCADFVSLVMNIAYKGQTPLPETGASYDMLRLAHKAGWVVAVPQIDDLFFLIHPDGTAHHVGIVTDAANVAHGQIAAIAGNTSPDGKSSDGTGVFEHGLALSSSVVFVRLPKEF